ncbi:MAG: 16S rRNA (cytidine(1402)-2'-O)-methyltransferase [Alphaproteobacteria bacterium]|nr:16S rRNA (cytidine(1402)-2'-O)-methyltransferase [Alphaproteobacteria bacterium]
MRNKLTAGLYIIATPIGNSKDITLRAIDTLKSVDAVACEDTRVTGKLFSMLGIKASLFPYHEHNADKMKTVILERIKKGQAIALVSDAGTPLVSDPGFKLVRDCASENLYYTTLPGASSIMSALILSALPTNRFMFSGFLPPKQGARIKALEELKNIPATLIFFESARRLSACLKDMAEVFGARNAAVTREMTKMYEETRRETLTELAEQYASEPAPKGEIVIVVNAPDKTAKQLEPEEIDDLVRKALKTMSTKDTAAFVAEQTGLPRKEIYARVIEIKNSET